VIDVFDESDFDEQLDVVTGIHQTREQVACLDDDFFHDRFRPFEQVVYVCFLDVLHEVEEL